MYNKGMKIIILIMTLVSYYTIFEIELLHANQLKNATSPYLLQHSHNPVEWLSWEGEAFQKAKQEKKPLFASIGYSTCHWCHVMAKESFENKKIAKLLNDNFISIKVDREELPQVDALYQELFLKVKGRRGGWPLSVFMTPKGEVFYITGYIPAHDKSSAEGFDTLIPKLTQLFSDKKALSSAIKKLKCSETAKLTTNDTNISLDTLRKSLNESFDTNHYGFGNGAKFPQAAKLSLMLDLALLQHDIQLQNNFYKTLDAMALHGLYDQTEGGFFRYSTDMVWEIPHFEKMLYNQAELITLYTRAYNFSHKPLYKEVVQESISMVNKRFKKDDLYWSASNADSEREEGGFFTYTKEEIMKALEHNKHKEEIVEALGFIIEGNFKDKVHLGFESDVRPKGFTAFKEELQKIRAKKIYPFIDKKINTAWNAMMIEALYKASSTNKKYKIMADNSLAVVTKLMFQRGELYHQTLLGLEPKQKGLLEDYSFLISALISGYEVDYDEAKLDFAEYLLSAAKERFYKNGIWYLSDDSLKVKARTDDKYYTAALSKMIQNILQLASLKAAFRYEKEANKTIKYLQQELLEKQSETPALAKAYLMQSLGIITLKSSKKNLIQNRSMITQIKYPYMLTKSVEDDEFIACTLRQCFIADKSLEKVIGFIDSDIRK
jgi:uncharacterized protein YyaL (SSP411 family)